MSDEEALKSPKPFPESLCHGCNALKLVKGAQSVFLMCTALPNKYPRQPVVTCAAFVAANGQSPSSTR
jgi:hypothetical protein